MSFKYEFRSEDKCYFSYSVPYTYSKLRSYLTTKKSAQHELAEEEQFLKEEMLCKSLSGVYVPLLTITENINSSMASYKEQTDENDS